MVIRINFFIRGFAGICIFPFIFIKKQSTVLINHEKIHYEQQKELLVIPFYIWYALEFCYHWARSKNSKQAYHAIRFEREAYDNEHNPSYLEQRKRYNYLKL
jgi:hypothetical protein